MGSRFAATLVAVTIGMTFAAVPAGAKPAPVTKLKLTLDEHVVEAGAPMTVSVRGRTKGGSAWEPFAGAALSVRVDGVEVATMTTDATGLAAMVYDAPATEGEHVMKVVFAGDDAHRRAQRAQGFEVVPSAPTAPDAPAITAAPGMGVVTLSWAAPADGGSPIIGYNVYRGDTSGGQTLLATLGPVTSYDDTTVLAGSTYYYYVTAVNVVGESTPSAEHSVMPA